jgi:hypothetical protein
MAAAAVGGYTIDDHRHLLTSGLREVFEAFRKEVLARRCSRSKLSARRCSRLSCATRLKPLTRGRRSDRSGAAEALPHRPRGSAALHRGRSVPVVRCRGASAHVAGDRHRHVTPAAPDTSLGVPSAVTANTPLMCRSSSPFCRARSPRRSRSCGSPTAPARRTATGSSSSRSSPPRSASAASSTCCARARTTGRFTSISSMARRRRAMPGPRSCTRRTASRSRGS